MTIPIIKIEKTASSNTEAMNLTKNDNLAEGTIVWVLNQTNGRGQGNKKWQSNANENLTFSVILKPSFLPLEKQFFLSKMAAVSVSKVIACFCSDTFIKWPNDIYIKNSKIAGILIENTIQGQRLNDCIVGIGMNVNQEKFSPDIPNPTSLFIENKMKYELEPLLLLLQQSILEEYEKLKNGQYKLLEDYYDSLLYKKNQSITIINKQKEQKVKIVKVDSKGFIHLLTDNKIQKFSVGEIEFVIEKK